MRRRCHCDSIILPVVIGSWHHEGKAVVNMLTSVESYLRRGQRLIRRLWLHPWVRWAATAAAWSGGGFLLAAGSILRYAQPLAMGCILGLKGWPALTMALGAGLGYWTFWGESGVTGLAWSGASGLLAVLLRGRVPTREQPLILPALGAFLTAVTGLIFRLLLGEGVPVGIYFLQIAVAFLSALVFTQAATRRHPLTDWLASAIAMLALAQVAPVAGISLGYPVGGVVSQIFPLPGVVLAGLGLDLAGITALPMTAVLALAWMGRMVPLERRWLRSFLPAVSAGVVMALTGCWEIAPLPGLLLGGALGYLLPPRPETMPRRGETGFAQVRLELGAQVMRAARQVLLDAPQSPIDQDAILGKVRARACGSCSFRKTCPEQETLTAFHLNNPLEVDCRKQGRLIPELRRGQEQLRLLKADHHRREEYRRALAQQYQFLGDYLGELADSLPRRGQRLQACYRVEAAARSRSRHSVNGDRCLAFPGPECRYYVLLCDGMGTGPEAAQAGQRAGGLLQQLLTAGFPPSHALRTVNSLLALEGRAGAVTLDLAEVHLDTGIARLYKWGAAPSWLLTAREMKKLGTATPPPGLSLDGSEETVEKLSLIRGEALILLSDGVAGEESLRRSGLTPDGPPGELAAKILGVGGRSGDDATAVVIRLYPVRLAP